MRVCDKCKQEVKVIGKTIIRGKEFELCQECSAKIIDWIERKEGNFLQNIFGR